MGFKIHELIYCIFPCEAGNQFCLMLPAKLLVTPTYKVPFFLLARMYTKNKVSMRNS